MTDLQLSLPLLHGLAPAKFSGLSCSSGHHGALLKLEEVKFTEVDIPDIRYDVFPSIQYTGKNKLPISFPIYSIK